MSVLENFNVVTNERQLSKRILSFCLGTKIDKAGKNVKGLSAKLTAVRYEISNCHEQ